MVKPTLVIHIGAHKTGTTSIQHFCNHNYNQLIKQGILYAKRLRILNDNTAHFAHHDFAWYLGFANKTSRLKNPKAFHIKLLNEVEKTSAHTVFISSESFEYSKSIQSIINLKNIFGPYFTIKILMYIRRQDFLLESIYKQHVKMGLATDIKSFYNKTKIYYLDVLNNWASVFGDEQIDVKVFDDEEVKSRLLANLLEYLGINHHDQWINEFQVKQNESFTNFHTSLIAQLNAFTKGKVSSKVFDFFIHLYQNNNFEKDASRLFTIDEVRHILEFYRIENEAIKNRFLPHRQILFSFDETIEFEKFKYFKEEKIDPKILTVMAHLLNYNKP